MSIVVVIAALSPLLMLDPCDVNMLCCSRRRGAALKKQGFGLHAKHMSKQFQCSFLHSDSLNDIKWQGRFGAPVPLSQLSVPGIYLACRLQLTGTRAKKAIIALVDQ